MPEDSKSENILKNKLNATGNKISELSKKVAQSTTEAIDKATESIQTVVNQKKENISAKREEKIQSLKTDISSEEPIMDIPPMVTLPEFENQRMAIVKEQQGNKIALVEHMERLSKRIDRIEKRFKSFAEVEIERLQTVADDEVSYSVTNGIKRSLLYLGNTMVIIFLSILINSKMENDPRLILEISIMTWSWSLIFALWCWMTTYILQKQTPTFIIPRYISFTMVLCFGLSGGLLHYLVGETQIIAIVGGFIASLAFTIILGLGLLGPMNKE